MKNRLKLQMQDIRVLILNVIIAVLVVLLFIMGALTVKEFSYAVDKGYEEEVFVYRLNDESYETMLELYHTNDALSVKLSQEGEEYYNAAQYYEAATYYKMFLEAGDSLRAEKYLEKMNEAAKELGELGFVREKMDVRLGIE